MATTERTGSVLSRLQVPTDIVILIVLWRLRLKMSLRDLAEVLLLRGFVFSHEAVREQEARIAPCSPMPCASVVDARSAGAGTWTRPT
ncbi:hypothetical protein [Azospirillum brasilense]|uniref:hypothetical protein n=1 Tax=Azospirillum brasilense TaxID=192 RepID=UPI001EDA66B4|nr:hypothetical protein [Azospirillum brasilense]UKJ76803.1 hypothetical protein H1Q64_24135 [Azospirillum brasilense]